LLVVAAQTLPMALKPIAVRRPRKSTITAIVTVEKGLIKDGKDEEMRLALVSRISAAGCELLSLRDCGGEAMSEEG